MEPFSRSKLRQNTVCNSRVIEQSYSSKCIVMFDSLKCHLAKTINKITAEQGKLCIKIDYVISGNVHDVKSTLNRPEPNESDK